MRELTQRQSNQSEDRDSQLLLPVADLKAQWKKKGKDFTVPAKTPKRTEDKGTTGMAHLCGSTR
jgi:hypothetical protein